MHFAAALTVVLGAASGVLAMPTPAAEAAAAKTLVKVDLPAPNNWLTGRRLFPGNVIAGYSAEIDKYTAETWNAYVLAQCQTFSACTSTASYSGINSGSTGGRYWFGQVYRGGPTTPADYERESSPEFGVADSQMYTVKA